MCSSVRATLSRERVVDEEGLALGVIFFGPWFSLSTPTFFDPTARHQDATFIISFVDSV